MKRPHLLALSALIVIALIVFAPPLFKNEVFFARDHGDYFQPLRYFTAAQLRAGQLPLWNAYSASGEPWLANPQTGVFYPPAWLFVFLPFATAYILYLLLHALLMGGGAYAWLGRRVSSPAALVGAVALMLSGPILSALDVSNNFTTLAWLPLILRRAELDRERPKPHLSALLLAAAFLAGEPFFAMLFAIAYAFIVRHARTIAITGALAAALSAIQLLPFIEWIAGSDRVGGFAASDVLRESMHFADWLRLAVPSPLAARFGFRAMQQFVAIEYAGILVVALAVIGACFLKRRAIVPLVVIAITIVVASGPPLIALLPITLFRYPSRLVPFAIFAIIVLAAAGWDRIRRGSVVVDFVLVAAIAFELLAASRPILATRPFAPRSPYPPSIGRSGKLVRLPELRHSSRAAWIAGYLNLYDRRFDAYTAAPVISARYAALYADAMLRLDALRSMGAAYVLADRGLGGSFVPVAHAERVFVYRVDRTLPMVYISGAGRLQAPLSYAFDASLVRITVDSMIGGRVVLTQNDAPGWKVSVDGKDATKKLERGVFRAVDVTPGRHEITWRYRPLSLIAGAIITLVAIVFSVVETRRALLASK
jgi:hypothetical protein